MYSNRSIIALDLNGKPLPAIHGGPVRLITPGVFATMNMKWLKELNFVGEESSNYNHLPRYRVPRSTIAPGSEYEFTFENSRFNWNMKVKSIILTPNDGDVIKAGATNVRGVAFNDGRTRIGSRLSVFQPGRKLGKGGYSVSRQPVCVDAVFTEKTTRCGTTSHLVPSHRCLRQDTAQ